MMAAGARTVGAAEFAELMSGLGPFEAKPKLAVAVSGGRDSLALTLLADEWARARGGAVLALSVDHGLRPEAAGEAAQVAMWLRRRGIAHRTLRWREAKPSTGLQAAARAARYRLLQAACRQRGILHLLLGHQRQDQLATHLMRRARGGGRDGLAAMPALRLEGGVRLLRPLLAIDRERLTAALQARGQAWLDDPSNADARFERTRAERLLSEEAPGPAGRAQLALSVRRAGAERAARERQLARQAAQAVRLFPAGYALLAPPALLQASADVRAALLRRLIMTVGGGGYPPRSERLARFVRAFEAAPTSLRWTLGGCRVAPWRGQLCFSRETRHLRRRQPILAGERLRWDRFECRLAGVAEGAFAIGILDAEGWRRVRAVAAGEEVELPPEVTPALPALWQDEATPVAVPHLPYFRRAPRNLRFSAEFRPLQPLTPVPFVVASPTRETM